MPRAPASRTRSQLPEANVRIVVPLLGGGFGAKCDFHFEGHVAALARAARRPVKLVFSRREEFAVTGHRREGMVIELETGVPPRRDARRAPGAPRARQGRLLRRGRLLRPDGGDARLWSLRDRERQRRVVSELLEHPAVELDPGPDRSAGVLGARAAHGRARRPARARSRRAPPPHPASTTGDEGPTRPDVRADRHEGDPGAGRRADRLRADLPDDEAIGVACGWWPCFGSASGAYVKLNADGTATIVTGAQENGTGAVMALPILAAEELGMEPENFSLLYQDTDAGPRTWARAAPRPPSTAAARSSRRPSTCGSSCSTRPPRSSRPIAATSSWPTAPYASRAAPDTSVTIADLAGSGATFHGKGSGEVPDSPPCDAEGCVGRLGNESFLAPQLITHAAHVKVDRDTGVVRVLRVRPPRTTAARSSTRSGRTGR